jgi:magnesium transporter
MTSKSLLSYINPLEYLKTTKVIHANPTLLPERKEEIAPIYTVYEYNDKYCESLDLGKVEDCFSYIDSASNTWINVDGLKVREVEILCKKYNIHPLIVEDILSLGQRPKMEEVNGLVFCTLNMLFYNAQNHSVEREQISMVLGERFVISFQEDPKRDVFKPLRDRLKFDGSKVRQNKADFLFYILVDLIVDNYYIVIERLAERIVILEEDILKRADTRNLAKINRLRNEMIVMKQSIAPVRELVNGILRSENELIDERTEKYFKDVYDHIVQANELCENYRDMIMSLQDLYMSMVNLKMNEVMKVMAVVTCLLAPATVIGGIFGMNFDKIPLLHNQWGFYISVVIMLIIPIVMIRQFKKRGWF